MSADIFVIHWNAREADTYADALREKGWNVVGIESQDGGRAAGAIRELLPAVLVVYLTRSPSHGRETAEYVARTKATQDVQIVFVGGKSHSVGKTRMKLPDAHFVDDDADLHVALQAIVSPD